MINTKKTNSKRKKAFVATGGVIGISALTLLVVGSGATWTDEATIGQQFNSGSSSFQVEVSTDGGETWSSDTVYENSGEIIINYAELDFDGIYSREGYPVFSQGQTQSANFLIRTVSENDTAVVWVSDAGEDESDSFSWEVFTDTDQLVANGSLGVIDNNEIIVMEANEEIELTLEVTNVSALAPGEILTGYWVISAQESNFYNASQNTEK